MKWITDKKENIKCKKHQIFLFLYFLSRLWKNKKKKPFEFEINAYFYFQLMKMAWRFSFYRKSILTLKESRLKVQK